MARYIDRTFRKFDASEPLVAKRQLTLLGEPVAKGEPIPDKVDLAVRRRLWMTRHADYKKDYTPTPEQETHGAGKEWMDEADGVSVTEGENGWFTIHAAWLGEDGEKVRGAEAAEARAAEVREEGDTKGISYAHSGGGWYLITGPGVPEDTKVKGEDAAKAKVKELREAASSAPAPLSAEELSALVKVEADPENEGEFIVSAPWLEGPERFADEGAATERQAAIREAGPPEGWTPSAETEAGE